MRRYLVKLEEIPDLGAAVCQRAFEFEKRWFRGTITSHRFDLYSAEVFEPELVTD